MSDPPLCPTCGRVMVRLAARPNWHCRPRDSNGNYLHWVMTGEHPAEGPPSDPWFVISDESERGLKPVPGAGLIPEDEEGPDAESEEKP